MKWFYLLGAIAGAATTWWFNIQAMQELGTGFTPQAFFMIGFEGSPMLASMAADFWIGSTVSLVWMVVEARRLRIRHSWFFVITTFGVAWAFALPLFLFVRARHLEREERQAEG